MVSKQSKGKTVVVLGSVVLLASLVVMYVYCDSLYKNRKIPPGNRADYWISRATKELYLRRPEMVIENAQRALKLNNKSADAYQIWCMALEMQGEYDRAIEKCERAISLDPNLTTARRALVTIYINASEYEKALSESERFIENNPDDPEALILKAEALYYLEKYKESLSCLEIAEDLDSLYWRVFLIRARCLYRLRQPHDAASNYSKAIELVESAPNLALRWGLKLFCYYKWGQSLQDIGDSTRALDMYKHTLASFDTAIAYFDEPQKKEWTGIIDSLKIQYGNVPSEKR